MIEVDISNVWGELALPDLLATEREVFDAHAKLMEEAGESGAFCGWMEAFGEDPEQLPRIQECARKIRTDSEVCVVVGTDSSCLGARAAIELLQGVDHNIGKGKGDPQIFFVGNSFSTRRWKQLQRLLEEKDYSVIVISGAEFGLEPALAFRELRWVLERKYGTDGANARIYGITDPEQGALRQMAQEAGWQSFALPAGMNGASSVLTAAGLLPMAVAGLDIAEVWQGAMEGKQSYALRSYENPAWLYAAVRNQLYRSGKKIELFASFESGFRSFGSWWQQLFGNAGGKEETGIFPAAAEYPADLHALGQLLRQGERNLVETMVRFAPCDAEQTIVGDWKNLDDLNFLEGKTLNFVEEQAYAGTLDLHVDSRVPVITMDCPELKERTLGELFYFLELSCGICGCVLGADPFRGAGMEVYRQNLLRLLGKPGMET